jgi:hypothetical protein
VRAVPFSSAAGFGVSFIGALRSSIGDPVGRRWVRVQARFP